MNDDLAVSPAYSIVAWKFIRAEFTIGIWDLNLFEDTSDVNWSLFTYSTGLLLEAVASRILSDKAIPQLRVTKGIDEICLSPLFV